MKIPSRDLQERVFGFFTEEDPPEGSIKAKVYAALNEDLTEEQIETLAQTFKRIHRAVQEKTINTIVEKKAAKN